MTRLKAFHFVCAAILLGFYAEPAAAQRRTCTQAYEECRIQSGNSPRCSSALPRCMQTGIWIGPITGRNAGRHIRK